MTRFVLYLFALVVLIYYFASKKKKKVGNEATFNSKSKSYKDIIYQKDDIIVAKGTAKESAHNKI